MADPPQLTLSPVPVRTVTAALEGLSLEGPAAAAPQEAPLAASSPPSPQPSPQPIRFPLSTSSSPFIPPSPSASPSAPSLSPAPSPSLSPSLYGPPPSSTGSGGTLPSPSFSPAPRFSEHGHPINLVLFHGKCPDGLGAAACAYSFLGPLASYHPCFHGSMIPLSLVKDKHVLVLDFCFAPHFTQKLKRAAASYLVLDHHSSALQENGHDPSCYFDLGHSGARLAWDFFNSLAEPDGTLSPSSPPPPLMIDFIEDRDLWRWQLPHSKEFAAVVDTLPQTVEAYAHFLHQTQADPSLIPGSILRGADMCLYRDNIINQLVKTAARRSWLGFRVMIVNSSLLQSEIGNAVAANDDCDIAIVWSYDAFDKSCRLSLRSSKDLDPNLGTIAKQFGGGGHIRAAGMKWKSDSIESLFTRHIGLTWKPNSSHY